MFNKYYQDELAYLRDMGREFAALNPESAGWLAQPGVDPDVERLLEGFAFLTARIREKLDDELPEFTHSMLQLFWPHYLRPVPSCTVVQFNPKQKAAGKLQQIKRGTEVASKPIDGTPVLFRTTADVEVSALKVSELEVGPPSSPYIRLGLELTGAQLAKLKLKKLRLFLTGGAAVTRALRLALGRYTKSVTARAGDTEVQLPDAKVVCGGFSPKEALLPFPPVSMPGFRLMQEYFAFPAKFMFLDVRGLAPLAELGGANKFELFFELNALPHDMPPASAANVLLNCAPALNLFKHDADPIRIDHARTEYKVRAGGPSPRNYEVYGLSKVVGIRRGDPKPRTYSPFFTFYRRPTGESRLYKTRIVKSPLHEGTETWLTLIGDGQAEELSTETVSIELSCTNRALPSNLGLGDLNQSTASSPGQCTFGNVIPCTSPVSPPLDDDLYWSLLSHLSLNYQSLINVDALGEVLRLYDFRSRYDRQAKMALKRRLDGLAAISAAGHTRLSQGTTIRGTRITVEIDEQRFGGEGEVFLFGGVLDEFFAHYVTINSYSELHVKGKKFGEVHTWPPRTGARITL